jgi:lipopolysaccharide/colanic/teichoic acid biosynthesis glycosyltransferase
MVLAVVSGLFVGVLSNRPKEERMSAARFLAVVIAFASLALMAPLMLVIAMGIRLSVSGPVLTRATRRRSDGTDFAYVRFRTTDRESGQPSDFGRFVRRMSLDDMPALVSLLRGEITLTDAWEIGFHPTA